MNLIKFFNQRRQSANSKRGIAAMEMALTLPIWMAMLVGVADMTYSLLVNQRVDRVSYTVTDLVTQAQSLKITDLDNIMLVSNQLMQPFPFANKGYVIVSSIYKAAGVAPKILWQYKSGGTLVYTSRIGAVNSVPTLPTGFSLNDFDNVIAVEVFYAYTPLFINAGYTSKKDIYREIFYKPRLSALTATPT